MSSRPLRRHESGRAVTRSTGLLPVLSCLAILTFTYCLVSPSDSWSLTVPNINIGVEQTDDPGRVATVMEILLMLTVLSIAPALLLMMTSFTRLIVVFGFLRQAIGIQQMPPNQVIIALALFLTFFIMHPVWTQANSTGLQPYLNEEISFDDAVSQVQIPIRNFMFKQTRKADLALFSRMANLEKPKNKEDVPTIVLIPAFMISELKTAFQIGFVLYIPFLIIDMVVASVLLSMGMMMLPPVLISLPFKLLLFVLVDGWNLLVGSMIKSFF